MKDKLLKLLASSLILASVPGCLSSPPLSAPAEPDRSPAALSGPAPYGTIRADTSHLEKARIDPELATRFKLVDIKDLDLRVPGRVLDPPSSAKAILPQNEEIEQEIWQKANNENERNIDTCVQKFVDLRGHTLRILGELRE